MLGPSITRGLRQSAVLSTWWGYQYQGYAHDWKLLPSTPWLHCVATITVAYQCCTAYIATMNAAGRYRYAKNISNVQKQVCCIIMLISELDESSIRSVVSYTHPLGICRYAYLPPT